MTSDSIYGGWAPERLANDVAGHYSVLVQRNLREMELAANGASWLVRYIARVRQSFAGANFETSVLVAEHECQTWNEQNQHLEHPARRMLAQLGVHNARVSI